MSRPPPRATAALFLAAAALGCAWNSGQNAPAQEPQPAGHAATTGCDGEQRTRDERLGRIADRLGALSYHELRALVLTEDWIRSGIGPLTAP